VSVGLSLAVLLVTLLIAPGEGLVFRGILLYSRVSGARRVAAIATVVARE
jgi:hypothetical protein